MSDTKENGFIKIIKFIIKFLAELFKDTDTSKEVVKLKSDIDGGKKEIQSREVKAREILSGMSEDAKDVVIEEGSKFLIENHEVLLGLSPEQREYTMNLSYLLSIKDLSELTLEELLEYRKLATKVASLGPDVATQLHSFGEEFSNTVNAIVNKCVDIGVRAGALALKTAIPVLSMI